jgi:hypothetical protein
VNWLWWVLGAASLARIGWHEVTEHHVLRYLLRRHVTPSPHHAMWDGIGRPQRRAIHAEMAVSAVLMAAVTGSWPVVGLVLAGILTVTCTGWSLFHRQSRAH